MWAQVMTAPRTMQLQAVLEIEPTSLEPGEVWVQFRAGSICGSDLPFFKGTSPSAHLGYGQAGQPLHEVVGTVVHGNQADLKAGERVVGWAKHDRGLAEYFVADAASLTPIGGELSDIDATMLQPLACVLYAVSRLGNLRGKRAAVIGQGPLGTLFSYVLKTAGATHVTGVDLIDRDREGDYFGVDSVICSSSQDWAAGLNPTDRPDIVIEAVGHQVRTLNDAIRATAADGTVYAFGVPDNSIYAVEFERLFRENLSILSGVTRQRRHWLLEATRYILVHQELPHIFITHRFPADRAAEAFQAASRPAIGQLKIAIGPPAHGSAA
ncbi:MAG: idnD [Pseudonocardiales bacterium]|nr:idnD [Pseudonocardiales bacterium]